MEQLKTKCPGRMVPDGASLKERAEACRGCTVSNCASRQQSDSSASNRTMVVALAGILFAILAAILLLLQVF